MEQIFLYLAILAALAGFGMGLMNLAGPWLERKNIALPSVRIASDIKLRITSLRGRERTDGDDENADDLEDDDLTAARSFAESSFAPDSSLLVRRRATGEEDEEDLDEELVGVLDEVAEEAIYTDEEDEQDKDADEGTVVFTVAGTVSDEAEDAGDEGHDDEDDLFGAVSEGEDEASEQDEDDELEDEDESEEEEDPVVQVVAAGGGGEDDMMSFFDEAADAGAGAVAAWRADLPEVSIEELLAEAQAIRAQIRGKKSDAA